MKRRNPWNRRLDNRSWVYLLLIVVGTALAIGIAGFPSSRHDDPVRVLTTSTVAPAPPATG